MSERARASVLWHLGLALLAAAGDDIRWQIENLIADLEHDEEGDEQ